MNSMIKQFSAFTILMLLLATSAYAGDDVQKEKVVTAKWSFVSGKAKVADHFLSDQEHNGWFRHSRSSDDTFPS